MDIKLSDQKYFVEFYTRESCIYSILEACNDLSQAVKDCECCDYLEDYLWLKVEPILRKELIEGMGNMIVALGQIMELYGISQEELQSAVNTADAVNRKDFLENKGE